MPTRAPAANALWRRKPDLLERKPTWRPTLGGSACARACLALLKRQVGWGLDLLRVLFWRNKVSAIGRNGVANESFNGLLILVGALCGLGGATQWAPGQLWLRATFATWSTVRRLSASYGASAIELVRPSVRF